MLATKTKVTPVESQILFALNDRTLYGIEIARHIERCTGVKMSDGALYPVLTSLQQKGLVDRKWGEDQGSGGRRKYIKATQEGLDAIEELLEQQERLMSDYQA